MRTGKPDASSPVFEAPAWRQGITHRDGCVSEGKTQQSFLHNPACTCAVQQCCSGKQAVLQPKGAELAERCASYATRQHILLPENLPHLCKKVETAPDSTLRRAKVNSLQLFDHTALNSSAAMNKELNFNLILALYQSRPTTFSSAADTAVAEGRAAPCSSEEPPFCWETPILISKKLGPKLQPERHSRWSMTEPLCWASNLPCSFTAISCSSFFPCFSKPSCCY